MGALRGCQRVAGAHLLGAPGEGGHEVGEDVLHDDHPLVGVARLTGPQCGCNAVQPGWIMTAMADDGFSLARDPESARRDALCFMIDGGLTAASPLNPGLL